MSSKNVHRLAAREIDIELEAELVVQPRIVGPPSDLVLGHHQPRRYEREPRGIRRQPPFAAPLPRHVDEDRLTIAQHHGTVFENGKLAKGIEVDERRLLVRAFEKIHGDGIERHAEQRCQQTHFVAVAG